MRRKEKNNPQNPGYPQQNGYIPTGMPPYQGYPSQQGYQPQQGYSQPSAYPAQQDYAQSQGYPPQPVFQGTSAFQNRQVAGIQNPAAAQESSPAYIGQGSFAQAGFSQTGYAQGFAQNPSGYPGDSYVQQTGGQQQLSPPAPAGYGYTGSQQPAGSYIPQSPYNQGYPGQGYQTPSGYTSGYGAYSQMGRAPQTPVNPQQEYGGQVPLNGGGYVPQPVPVRKRPFVMTDAYLLLLSALALILFALSFIPGFSFMKYAFLAVAAGSTALLWIKPMVDGNKRLCYTIVFGLLILVTIIGMVTGNQDGTNDRRNTGSDTANSSSSVPAEVNGQQVSILEASPTPSVTYTPEPDLDSAVTQRLREFFNYWSGNRQDDMLTLCSPTWISKQENPKTELFGLMANRTPKDYNEENISGTSNDETRTVTITSTMDRNNGKGDVKYRINVIMVKENDGLWYVDPESLQSNEKADTPDPSITDTPAPTETPVTNANTVLYYNTNGGEYYHRDQNCKRINERYLPLQGHFTYDQLDKEPYNKLKPCAICGAPSRGQ